MIITVAGNYAPLWPIRGYWKTLACEATSWTQSHRIIDGDSPALKPNDPRICVILVLRRSECAVRSLSLERPEEQGVVGVVWTVYRDVPGEAARQRDVPKVWQRIVDLEVCMVFETFPSQREIQAKINIYGATYNPANRGRTALQADLARREGKTRAALAVAQRPCSARGWRKTRGEVGSSC